VKNGKNAMLFERPDTPCCIPHLRRRGIWVSVLFDWVSNSLYSIKRWDKSTKLPEEFKVRFGVLEDEPLELPSLLRSLQPIKQSRISGNGCLCVIVSQILKCFCEILQGPFIPRKHETLRIRNLIMK
jgi:hypothetical protein